MSTEEKFHAAVNVIRSLPKSGSYQPSHDTMLKFYSYFKQATEGKVKGGRPGLWNPINRVKWDAWNRLGDMSKEKAMESYVSELHKIVETMAYTDNVATFMNTVDDDLPFPRDDLELIAGDIFKKLRENYSSSESSPDASPLHNIPLQNGQCDSDDDFIDTVEHSEESEIPIMHANENGFIPNGHGKHHVTATYDKTNDINNQVLDQLRRTVANLEKDMSNIKEKMLLMEKERRKTNQSVLSMRPKWWPLPGVSPALFGFIILWPFVALRIADTMRRKQSS